MKNNNILYKIGSAVLGVLIILMIINLLFSLSVWLIRIVGVAIIIVLVMTVYNFVKSKMK